jgi:hypothetical protein
VRLASIPSTQHQCKALVVSRVPFRDRSIHYLVLIPMVLFSHSKAQPISPGYPPPRKPPLGTIFVFHKTRQEKRRQEKTREDKRREDKTKDKTKDKTRQDKTRQDKTSQDNTRHDKTRQQKILSSSIFFAVRILESRHLTKKC